jgi:hypothetical protein
MFPPYSGYHHCRERPVQRQVDDDGRVRGAVRVGARAGVDKQCVLDKFGSYMHNSEEKVSEEKVWYFLRIARKKATKQCGIQQI